MQKYVVFLYTNNYLSETKENNPIYNSMKNNKKTSINLIKEVNDLNIENYKRLMKETEDNTNKWKNISCSWIRRTDMSTQPKAT